MKVVLRGAGAIAILATVLIGGTLSGCGPSAEEKQIAREAAETARQQAELQIQREAEAQRLAAEEAERARVAAVWKSCIETTLQQDAAIPPRSGAAYIVSQMKIIDTTSCPAEFREAFLAHIQAWDNTAEIEESLALLNSEDNVNTTVGAQVLASLFKTGDRPYQNHMDADRRLRQARSESSAGIRSSYQAVQRVAVRFGAALPPA
jgi:outer membrane murein-binding lipoprotein Lpp